MCPAMFKSRSASSLCCYKSLFFFRFLLHVYLACPGLAPDNKKCVECLPVQFCHITLPWITCINLLSFSCCIGLLVDSI
uniref:Uncharacterized protein n=1 Tax=Aegilops tauschii subsp. strangulata TaxID=200361 RepID=A0A453LSK6_AEGTS